MRAMKAEYTIRKGAKSKVEKAIRSFVRAVDRNEKEKTLMYEAFRVGETNKYVHVMVFLDAKSEKMHAGAKHTKKFVDVLYPVCVRLPAFTVLEWIR